MILQTEFRLLLFKPFSGFLGQKEHGLLVLFFFSISHFVTKWLTNGSVQAVVSRNSSFVEFKQRSKLKELLHILDPQSPEDAGINRSMVFTLVFYDQVSTRRNFALFSKTTSFVERLLSLPVDIPSKTGRPTVPPTVVTSGTSCEIHNLELDCTLLHR